MGMYDELSFSYRMPNGREGCNYQTNDLDNWLDEYEVTPSGRLVRVVTNNESERPVVDLNFTGWLDISGSAGYFRLDFVNGALRAIQVIGEDGWLPFYPVTCLES